MLNRQGKTINTSAGLWLSFFKRWVHKYLNKFIKLRKAWCRLILGVNDGLIQFNGVFTFGFLNNGEFQLWDNKKKQWWEEWGLIERESKNGKDGVSRYFSECFQSWDEGQVRDRYNDSGEVAVEYPGN